MRIQSLGLKDIAAVRAATSVPLETRYSERSTYEVFRSGADQFGNSPALTFLLRGTLDERPIVYSHATLFARITQAANAFNRLGLGPTDVVAYVLPNLPQTHFTIWGGEAAGRVAAINPLLEPEQVLRLLRAVRARLLVTLAPGGSPLDLWAKCAAIAEQVETLEHVLCVDPAPFATGAASARSYEPLGRIAVHDFDAALAAESGAGLAFARDIAPDDIASLFHTGGTTGSPKVAPHTHGNEVFMAWAAASALEIEPGQTTFVGLPLFHVNAPVATGIAVWAAGGNVLLGTPGGYRTPGLLANLWGLLARHKVQAMMAVPTIYAALLDVPIGDYDISCMRRCYVGAAPMPVEVFRRFQQVTGLTLLEGYGMTEGAAVSSINPVQGESKVGSIGLPLPYAELRVGVVEGTRLQREAAVGEVGVLLMRGPNVFPGYLEQVHDAGAWVVDVEGRRWFNSGDLARTDEDGYLWLAGRAKDLIIRGGHNIDPQVIEETLCEHSDVAMAAAVGQPDAHAGEVPIAFVQLREGATATADSLRDFAAARIAERAAVPVRIEILPQMPVTAVGKIFKPRLRHLAIERVLGDALRVAGVAAEVEARDDKKHGTVLVVRLRDAAKRSAANEALARFP
ncbi:MAG: acyl-CoA synthetase, partial [Gammaproteobacteria bacterium]|nr:acyl-CoA synthetase [Gammaproteobacteria bacterium]